MLSPRTMRWQIRRRVRALVTCGLLLVNSAVAGGQDGRACGRASTNATTSNTERPELVRHVGLHANSANPSVLIEHEDRDNKTCTHKLYRNPKVGAIIIHLIRPWTMRLITLHADGFDGAVQRGARG